MLESRTPFSKYVVTLEMARRPQYTLWFVIVPLGLIVLLTTSAFWMGRDSLGIRMDFSFLGLLTIVAFQVTVESGLPNIAYFTLLSGYVYVAYLMMTGCIAANVYVGALDRRGAGARAQRFDLVARWAFPVGFAALSLLLLLFFYFD